MSDRGSSTPQDGGNGRLGLRRSWLSVPPPTSLLSRFNPKAASPQRRGRVSETPLASPSNVLCGACGPSRATPLKERSDCGRLARCFDHGGHELCLVRHGPAWRKRCRGLGVLSELCVCRSGRRGGDPALRSGGERSGMGLSLRGVVAPSAGRRRAVTANSCALQGGS